MQMQTIKFTQDRDTLKYGLVSAGDEISVHPDDAESFIAQGVAKTCSGKKPAAKNTEEVT